MDPLKTMKRFLMILFVLCLAAGFAFSEEGASDYIRSDDALLEPAQQSAAVQGGEESNEAAMKMEDAVLLSTEDSLYEAKLGTLQEEAEAIQKEIEFWTEARKKADERKEEAAKLLPEGVRPITWEPSPDHLIIESDEAKALYERIVAGDYPTLEELEANPVVAQIDSLSAYYIALYGSTLDIDSDYRRQIRGTIRDNFLKIGSARTERVDEETGKHHYVYDGPLKSEYKMVLVLGLPASGKSTFIVDPLSEEIGGFILDCDVIKEMIPEFQFSNGAGADAVHMESMEIMNRSMDAFLTGDMKGTNVILPLVSSDLDDLMNTYIKPFEEAGYTVKAMFREADPGDAAARVVMRELATGRIIRSAIAFSFGTKPEEVFHQLEEMVSESGEPYVDKVEEEELVPAA